MRKRNRKSLLGRAMRRLLDRRARGPVRPRSYAIAPPDPYLESMLADPDRHAAIMASLERQVNELGPVTR